MVHAAERDGILTGSVSNIATGQLLAGARVEVPVLQAVALTDETGRYVLSGLPAGNHDVVVSYIGLDSGRAIVAITSGERTVRNFDLTTAIYQLAVFKVAGEREGDAAAITSQRNATHLKNVVASDSFGNLPNMNAGEVAIRLPGVVGDLDASGNVFGFTVRGTNLNTVTMDGGQMTSQGALGRSSITNTMTATMFEAVELIKGHTPETGADSLGGTINFKSRSPLSMKEKRRVTYSLATRFVPSFTEQIPLREQHRAHPIVNVGYQEVFGVLGSERNLGVAVNLFYSETSLGWFNTTRDFQNTTEQPAYVWDYRTSDIYHLRQQGSANVKLDYRFSPETKFSFLGMGIDHKERFRRQYDVRAFTTQSIGTSGTAGILPGYTNRITEVRVTPASVIDVTSTGPNNFVNRTRKASFGGEHELDRWSIDYAASYSQTHIDLGNGQGGILTNRVAGVGWILDRTQSDLYPRFIQTGGPDIANPANYRPTGNLSNANNQQDHEIEEFRGNARYKLPISVPISLKIGAHFRAQRVDEGSLSRRWTYVGTAALPTNNAIVLSDIERTGRKIPQWEASDFIRARQPIDPSLWREDAYYFESNRYIADRDVTEAVTAGYAMAEGKLGESGLLGRTGFLGGVRTERTETESDGYVRARVPSTAAQQGTDPVGSAQRDYAGTRRHLDGGFKKAFPSAHITHDFTPNVKARVSWSTSYGKPSMANLLPNETESTASDGTRILTINNPSLRPQTAKNWDASLDWYFEPVGNLSIGWFHKSIKDYLVTGIAGGTVASGPDNGYNGDYAGDSIRTSQNAGGAIVQGWEFGYRQQFTFLPGLLKGLSGFVNYSILDTRGDFGGTAIRRNREVPGFTPRVGNASLSWRYQRFSTRILANYTGSAIATFSPAALGRNLYRAPRTVVNAGIAFQLRPGVSLTCDVDNLFNEAQEQYRGIPDQIASLSYPGTAVTIGISGRF